MNALILESTHSFEEGMTASISEGEIQISVAEEQAMDSYNERFECTMRLTSEQAVILRDWLTDAITKI